MNYKLIDSLAEISEEYDILLCDLWGCLHNGIAPHPSALAAIKDFRASGTNKYVVFITNAPRPSTDIKVQLDTMGVPDTLYDKIVTSGDAAHAALRDRTYGQKCFHLGPAKDNNIFDNTTLERVNNLKNADFIFCTGLFNDATETPDNYADFVQQAIQKDLKFLCANPDIIAHRGTQKIYCAGSIARAYQDAGGDVIYFGKPYHPIYDLALSNMNIDKNSKVLAVGDGIHTDILGAVNYGIHAIFITSGIATGETQNKAALDNFLKQYDYVPNYVMEDLR